MIDPYVELGGWIIVQAIEDALGGADVLEEDQIDAWRFLLFDGIVDHILDHIDYGQTHHLTKREFIIKIVIPDRASEVVRQEMTQPETIPV